MQKPEIALAIQSDKMDYQTYGALKGGSLGPQLSYPSG
jgi:hypothetical protein